MVVIALLGLTMLVTSVGLWIADSIRAQASSERQSMRLEAAEALVMNLATVEARLALDEAVANQNVGGAADIDAVMLSETVQSRVRAAVARYAVKESFSEWPIDSASIAVNYTQMSSAAPGGAGDAFIRERTLSLSAKPMVLIGPSGVGSANSPERFIEYVPERHPLAGMQSRRYPFGVSFTYSANGRSTTVTRRVSVFQVPLAQFARFSTGAADLTDVVLGSNTSVFAMGSLNGRVSGTLSRLWAAQVDSFEGVVGAGSEEDRLFGLNSTAQTGRSRIGGRISREQWSFMAPHFFGRRETGEKVDGGTRPTRVAGNALPKAYEARRFFEVVFHPERVTAESALSAPIELNVYDASGTMVQATVGRMRGQNAGETGGFVETLFGPTGDVIMERTSKLSVSETFAVPATRARAAFDFVALKAGRYVFRVTNPAGDGVDVAIDDTNVISGSTLEPTVAINLAGGWHRITMEHRGGNGAVALFVTPPSLPEAYAMQWGVAAGTLSAQRGSFESSDAFLTWRLIPTDVLSNTSGQPVAALVLNMDQPWTWDPEGTDVALYVEGVEEGESRYFTAGNSSWSKVVVELAGATLHPTTRARPTFSVLSANPIVVADALEAGTYHGLYLLSRGTEGPDTNSVYCGYDQASLKALEITGVIGGAQARYRSYFDRSSPSATTLTGRGADTNETNSFFKTIALIDDYVVSETTQ